MSRIDMLRQLAKRGVGGERVSAQERLNKMLQELNLPIENYENWIDPNSTEGKLVEVKERNIRFKKERWVRKKRLIREFFFDIVPMFFKLLFLIIIVLSKHLIRASIFLLGVFCVVLKFFSHYDYDSR